MDRITYYSIALHLIHFYKKIKAGTKGQLLFLFAHFTTGTVVDNSLMIRCMLFFDR